MLKEYIFTKIILIFEASAEELWDRNSFILDMGATSMLVTKLYTYSRNKLLKLLQQSITVWVLT